MRPGALHRGGLLDTLNEHFVKRPLATARREVERRQSRDRLKDLRTREKRPARSNEQDEVSLVADDAGSEESVDDSI